MTVEGKKISMPLLAYGSVPHASGTYTLYRNLRGELHKYGWDIKCVTIGAHEHSLCDPAFIDDGWVSLQPTERNIKAMAQAFERWCRSQNVKIVMPVNSAGMLASIPHLPQDIRYVPRCADTVEVGYQKAVYAKSRASRFVATTPRQQNDFFQKYGIPLEKISLIPHGIDVKLYGNDREKFNRKRTELRIAFVGNLNEQKGVLYLPEILQKLSVRGITYYLRIAGSGYYRSFLDRKINTNSVERHIKFLGMISNQQVQQLLDTSDVLLFPSNHEGFGFSLIEAMASGCVPISSHIPGVTDYIVDHGKTGILCPIGDTDSFAEALATLYNEKAFLRELSDNARLAANRRFSIQYVSQAYAALFDEVIEETAPTFLPVLWNDFRIPPPYKKRWKSFIPFYLLHPIRRMVSYLRKQAAKLHVLK